MPLIYVDILIKELRKSKGLSQSELSDGICTRDSLSRLERGGRRPDWFTLDLLMQRLGEDSRKYYTDVVTTIDKRVIGKREEIKDLLRNKNEKSDSEAAGLINELMHDKDFQVKANQQFLLKAKTTLAFHRNDYKSMYDYAVEALRITKTDFSEDKIDSYVLFFDEITLINQLAVAQSFLTSLEKSTDILLKLKASIDKNYSDNEEKAKSYMMLLYNITKNLGLLKRYEECIEMCDIGLDFCQKRRDSYYYPLILFNKAYCFLSSENTSEGMKLYKRVQALFTGFERFAELSYIDNFLAKEFGTSIPDLNPLPHKEECN